ncbi:GNAT family N-acetyltransferase [Lysobacter panacisoli]|uniref:GNAT family N-acetyltransferase n=1 Tax=Lysobacter panacisoli TaxID=1255263 RepID=A0ABP9LA84_9GAMM
MGEAMANALEIRPNLQERLDPDDVARIHGFLSQTYWAQGIPRETQERALAHSICYGGYVDGELIAFARAVSDRATFAYLADVFVLDAFRGRGFGRAIVAALMDDPALQGLRRWHLVTRDMHKLYAQLDFEPLTQPELHMQRHDPDVYRRAPAG